MPDISWLEIVIQAGSFGLVAYLVVHLAPKMLGAVVKSFEGSIERLVRMNEVARLDFLWALEQQRRQYRSREEMEAAIDQHRLAEGNGHDPR